MISLIVVTAADRAAATVQHIQYTQKASPARGGARRAGGGVPFSHATVDSRNFNGVYHPSGGTTSAEAPYSNASRSSRERVLGGA